MPRELSDVIARPLSITFDSRPLAEVSKIWRKADVTPIFRKGQEEDPGNYRPGSLTSASGKVIEEE